MADKNTQIEEVSAPSETTSPSEDRVGFLSEEGRTHLVNLLNAGSKVQTTGCLASIVDGYEMSKAFRYFTEPDFDPKDVPKIPDGPDKLQNCSGGPDKALALIGVAIRIAIAGQAPKDHTSAYTINEVYPVVEAIRFFTVPQS